MQSAAGVNTQSLSTLKPIKVFFFNLSLKKVTAGSLGILLLSVFLHCLHKIYLLDAVNRKRNYFSVIRVCSSTYSFKCINVRAFGLED